MNQALDGANVAPVKMEASAFEYAGHTIHMLLPSAEDHISRTILNGKTFYEGELLQALDAELSEGELVLDVGANIGNHTIFFAKVSGCRVASFEPNPDAFRFLAENVRLNGLADRVELHPLAVGSTKGRASIISTLPNNLGATRFGMDESGAFETVRLDDMSFDGRVALLKIDVEGMDLEVLRGALETIAKHRPMIVCEAQTPEEFAQISHLLEEHEYAGVGCFNATDTFLFMPVKSPRERQRLMRREAMELVRTQMQVRAAKAQLQKHKQVIDKQAYLLRQLSALVEGEKDGPDGIAAQVRLLAAKTDQFGGLIEAISPRIDAAHAVASKVDRLDGQVGLLVPQLEQIRLLSSQVGTLEGQLGMLVPLIEQFDMLRSAQVKQAEQLPLLRAALSETGLRIDHALASRAKTEADHEVQIKRLDRRISEQVRVGKEATIETQAKLARIDQLEKEMRLLRDRHDALLEGRVFGFLRRIKRAIRFVAWPLLKVMGRVPASAPVSAITPSSKTPLQAPSTGAKPTSSASASSASVGAAATNAGSRASTASLVAAAAEEQAPPLVLTDVPYMRRPLKALKKNFLQLPIAEDALVSVIMTTYNSAKYLREAMDSILAQTHSNLELLVVDDCSSDETREIVQAKAAVDSRIRLLSFGENRGTYWCKNIGITRARGAAITFMDSDDVSEPTRIAKQLEQLRVPGTAVSTCLHERRDSAGNLIAVNGRTKRLAYISQMMRREVFEVIGYFDCVRTSADDEMLRRIKRVFGDSAHQCVQEVLYKALVHGESLTQDPSNRGVSATPGGLSGPRKAYSDAVDAWHADLARRGAYPLVPFPVVRRPFAVHSRLSVVRGDDRKDMISVCLASFPPRRSALRAAIGSLIDQVDRIYVYLNQYEEVPDFLKHPRISVKVGGEDLRDNGKFYFGAEVPDGYCFTVDDDIVYPPDYVQALVRKIEFYGRKAMVGLHGTIFAKPLVTYFTDRTLLHFKYPLDRDRIVNQLGTGTLAFHTSLWRPDHTAFRTTGMVDAWIAVEAAKRKIPLIAVERKRNWLKPMEEAAEAPPSLFKEYLNRDAVQTELVKTVASWVEEPGPGLAAVMAVRTAAGGQAFADGVAEISDTQPEPEPLPTADAPSRAGSQGLTVLHRSVEHATRPRTRGCVRFNPDTDRERMERFVEAMAGQLDELYVMLPSGHKVPEFLARPPNVHVCASEFTDARAQFDAIDGFRGYYLPLDLSVRYPKHYVRQLVDAIDRYGRKVVVGWHGHPAPAVEHESAGSDRQVNLLSSALSAFHTDTLKVTRADFAGVPDVDSTLARIGRVQGAALVEIDDAPTGSKASLRESYLASAPAAPTIVQQDIWTPLLPASYRRPTFRLAVVGRTDRARWKKGGILKSTHLTAEMLHPYGVDVVLVDLETGDPHGLDGKGADIVMIYPGDPERPDFVNVIDLVDHHAKQGRAVLVNLSLNGRSSRKKFICDQMRSWRAQYGKRVAMMVFSDRVFDDPELAPVLDAIVAIPKTLQLESPLHMDFHATSGIFLGDYGKLCDDSLLAWPAEDAISVLREAVPHAHLFAVQQYRPKIQKDLGVEILPFLSEDYSEVLAGARLMVSLVKFATFEMVPIEVASLGVPLLHAKMENSISDYMGLGAIEITSLERLGTYAKLVYSDPLCWSSLSRAGHAISNGLDYRNLSAQMYLRLLQFLRESGTTGTA